MGKTSILYGVPKVAYSRETCTPFPTCLSACAEYLGLSVDYTQVIAESGAAFRLAWDTSCWNGGNVDSIWTFDDAQKVLRCGLRALGRSLHMVVRSPETPREAFVELICSQIDRGYPVIALGVIGPPEACVVTGYQEDGKALLGWNVFQEYPEYQRKVQFQENGYFVTEAWWDNPNTLAVIATGTEPVEVFTAAEALKNAIEALEGRMCGTYAKGVLAYDAWKTALLRDSDFPPQAVLPLLVERMMCHGDAMDCLHDGRLNAAKYLRRMAQNHPAQAESLEAAAGAFDGVVSILWKEMIPMLGGEGRGEKQMRRLAELETRRLFAGMIDRMKSYDQQGLAHLRRAAAQMEG